MGLVQAVAENQNLTKKQIEKVDFKIKEPKYIQLEYYIELRKLSNQLKEDVNKQLIPLLNTVDLQPATFDSVSDILRVVAELQAKYANILAFSVPTATNVVSSVNRYNRDKFEKKGESQLGVNLAPVLNERNIQESLALETQRQTTLIRSIPDEFLKDVEITITNGFNNGLRAEEIERQLKGIKNISSIFGKLDNRVRMIARNEVGNINANLNRQRQQNAGIEYYEWQTSEDERVRPSHRALNGKICKWSDVAVYADNEEDARQGKWKKRSSIGGVEKHPGMDFNCRCLGLSVIELD